jgi:hypothetical protein
VRGARPQDLQVSAAGVVSLTAEGPEPLVAAELARAERTARELGGEPVPHTPPPRLTSRPHERALPLETIDTAMPGSALVGDALRVVSTVLGATKDALAQEYVKLAKAGPAQPDPAKLFAAL